jgi:hypothetical protein
MQSVATIERGPRYSLQVALLRAACEPPTPPGQGESPATRRKGAQINDERGSRCQQRGLTVLARVVPEQGVRWSELFLWPSSHVGARFITPPPPKKADQRVPCFLRRACSTRGRVSGCSCLQRLASKPFFFRAKLCAGVCVAKGDKGAGQARRHGALRRPGCISKGGDAGPNGMQRTARRALMNRLFLMTTAHRKSKSQISARLRARCRPRPRVTARERLIFRTRVDTRPLWAGAPEEDGANGRRGAVG